MEARAPYKSCQHPIVQPPQTLAINIFPATDGTEWDWPGPHIDGGGPAGEGWRTEPRPCRIQHMTYLTAPRSGASGGGGTVAWPGSHIALEQLYMVDKKAYEWMGCGLIEPSLYCTVYQIDALSDKGCHQHDAVIVFTGPNVVFRA